MTCVPAIFGDYALPVKSGTSFYNAALNGVDTIVAPASNVNGIRLATGTNIASSSGAVFLFVGTSAPSSYADTSKQVVFQLAQRIGQVINLTLPAGLGLYAATNENTQFCLNYDIL